MKRIIALSLFFVAAYAFSQQPTIKSGPPKEEKTTEAAPKISTELQKELFKAQSAYQSAESALEQTPQFKEMNKKRDDYQAAGQKVAAVCGAKFQLQVDPSSGDFICLAKPELKPPAAPTTEKK